MDKEGHYVMIKSQFSKKTYYSLIYMHLNYVRQKVIDVYREIVESIIRVGEFYTPLPEIDKSSRQKNQ